MCSLLQLVKMKEKNQWYADILKEKDLVVNKLNSKVARLAIDNDDLSNKCDCLKDKLTTSKQAADDQVQGRMCLCYYKPSALLSPYLKAYTIGLPPVPNCCNAH
jgi:hypothetical protein